MKTSVVEVREMLSVFSALGVEKRIGKVPGVESVTVNHAAGTATVRYDETRLEIADIKSAVRQNEYQSESESPPGHVSEHKQAHEQATTPIPVVAPTVPATERAAASPAAAGKGHEGHSAPGAQPAMSADMAHEMGHGGKDLPAMVRDMRNTSGSV